MQNLTPWCATKQLMNSDDHPESLKTSPRMGGGEDSLGKRRFQRVPGAGRPKGPRRKKLKSESSRGKCLRKVQRRNILIWSVLLCGIAIVAIGFFLSIWLIQGAKRTELESANYGVIPPKAEVKTKVVSQFPAPTSEEALALVRQALAVREPEKISGYFRLGEASPQEVIVFLKDMNVREGKIDSMKWLSSIGTTTIPLEGVLVYLKGNEGLGGRLVLLTPDSTGKWRIDFDAFARRVTPSWTDLLETQSATGTVRVFVKKDSYYNGPFMDNKKWLCYSIGSPDLNEPLRAYCKIGSSQAAALAWMLSKEMKITRATLKIRRVVGAEFRQFEIIEVLAEDWVIGGAPFEESFE